VLVAPIASWYCFRWSSWYKKAWPLVVSSSPVQREDHRPRHGCAVRALWPTTSPLLQFVWCVVRGGRVERREAGATLRCASPAARTAARIASCAHQQPVCDWRPTQREASARGGAKAHSPRRLNSVVTFGFPLNMAGYRISPVRLGHGLLGLHWEFLRL
jgi:hypothetical protein